jgi:hypothetical protein
MQFLILYNPQIFGTLFVIGGLYLCFKTMSARYWSKPDPNFWQEVVGTIADRKIKCIHAQDQNPGSQGNLGFYVAYIKYKYTISGTDYISRWKNFRQAEINVRFDEEVNFVFSDYKIGDTVEIVYDPTHPKRAVLKSEMLTVPSAKFMIIGVFLMGIGLYLFKQ